MPARYGIDLQQRLVHSSGEGRLTLEECLIHQRTLRTDPNFRPDFSQIMDFTRVEHIALTGADVRKLAEAAVFSPTARRVIVAPTVTAFGLARMFAMIREFAGERGILIARSRAEAEALLFQPQEIAQVV